MILHYNIYPSNMPSVGHIVRFYLSDCEVINIVHMCAYMRDKLDSSIGVCDFMDWDYKSGIGTARVCMQRGVEIDTTKSCMNQIQEELKHLINSVF